MLLYFYLGLNNIGIKENKLFIRKRFGTNIPFYELVTEIILWTDMDENPISAPEILENLVNQASQRIKVSRNHEENYDLLDPQGV